MLLRFENPLKQSTFNSTIVLGKIFRSIALTMQLVGATTNCEKIAISYRSVKNFDSQKVRRKELLQGIGGKNFGKKVCVVSCNQLEISIALPFRQVSKRIANLETDFSLSRNCPRNRCSDSVLPWVGWLSQG